ncbi:AAC(3) family N-acetyltransferase, partial [Enterobacter hormaechei]|uniref:AAC(3) family N-acetyltransferase n=1 Tax=Enterobacter hormaechei TaxID=158836 RepID=UPI002E2DE53C
SMVAVGPLAETLTEPHELGHALGEGSPVERFVRLGGKALLLGAPLNSVTALHYAEADADIPHKRWGTNEMAMLGRNGEVVWKTATEYDSNGLLGCFAIQGKPDAVVTIAKSYLKLGRHREGVVGFVQCYLLR